MDQPSNWLHYRGRKCALFVPRWSKRSASYCSTWAWKRPLHLHSCSSWPYGGALRSCRISGAYRWRRNLFHFYSTRGRPEARLEHCTWIAGTCRYCRTVGWNRKRLYPHDCHCYSAFDVATALSWATIRSADGVAEAVCASCSWAGATKRRHLTEQPRHLPPPSVWKFWEAANCSLSQRCDCRRSLSWRSCCCCCRSHRPYCH